jgi:hypothetical protein
VLVSHDPGDSINRNRLELGLELVALKRIIEQQRQEINELKNLKVILEDLQNSGRLASLTEKVSSTLSLEIPPPEDVSAPTAVSRAASAPLSGSGAMTAKASSSAGSAPAPDKAQEGNVGSLSPKTPKGSVRASKTRVVKNIRFHDHVTETEIDGRALSPVEQRMADMSPVEREDFVRILKGSSGKSWTGTLRRVYHHQDSFPRNPEKLNFQYVAWKHSRSSLLLYSPLRARTGASSTCSETLLRTSRQLPTLAVWIASVQSRACFRRTEPLTSSQGRSALAVERSPWPFPRLQKQHRSIHYRPSTPCHQGQAVQSAPPRKAVQEPQSAALPRVRLQWLLRSSARHDRSLCARALPTRCPRQRRSRQP